MKNLESGNGIVVGNGNIWSMYCGHSHQGENENQISGGKNIKKTERKWVIYMDSELHKNKDKSSD